MDWNTLTLGEVLRQTAQRFPDRTAIVGMGRRMTFTQLDRETDQIALGLRSLGVGRGDQVALWMTNCPDWVVCWMACARLGAVLVPINTRFKVGEAVDAAYRYFEATGRRVSIEYALIRDFNDSDADAKRLVRLLNPIRAKVNLIPLNDDAVCDLQTSLPERALRFQELLMSKSLMAIIRKSRGRDILAACGQLAADRGKANERSH